MGYSPFSGEVSVLAAQEPETPAAPTTLFETDKVTITWLEPFNNGSPITGYNVFIQKSDGEYI